MTALRIDMISDIVCPWCWLGLKRLDRALALVPEIEPDLRFHPFELDPNVPREGVDYRDYMRAKFGEAGPTDRFRAMREHLEAAAPAEGIVFRFDDIPRRVNTFDAHRLIRWAQGQGLGREAKEALFAAFFRDLRDVGDHGVLTEIASEIGLDSTLVAELLGNGRDTDAVRAEEAEIRRLGVASVPTFIFAGRYGAPGAQEAETLAGMIRKAAGVAA